MNEEWKPMPGYPNYEVSNTGFVRCIVDRRSRHKVQRPKRRKAKVNKGGYRTVSVRNERGILRTVYVHRKVLEAFVGEPWKHQVAKFIDGDKSNCRLDNLRWGRRTFGGVI